MIQVGLQGGAGEHGARVRAREAAAVVLHQLLHRGITANLPTNIMDVRGFDSSIILSLRGGIPESIGDVPESLSQAFFVGIMLVGILGVTRVYKPGGRIMIHRNPLRSHHVMHAWGNLGTLLFLHKHQETTVIVKWRRDCDVMYAPCFPNPREVPYDSCGWIVYVRTRRSEAADASKAPALCASARSCRGRQSLLSLLSFSS